MRHVHLRESLSWELAGAPNERIDRVLGREIAEDLEDLAGVARSLAPHIAKAAPGALKGAASGFLVGGPAGALAGGVAGGLTSSGVIPSTGPGAGQRGQAGASSRRAQPGAPIVNPAALRLLLTLLRPEVVEALIAMALGKNGSAGVEIAGQAVPVAAVTNLIQSLAETASATHHASGERSGVPRYLSEARRRGEDIGSREVRTAALLELIHDAWDDDIAEADDQADEHIADELDIEDIYPGELAS